MEKALAFHGIFGTVFVFCGWIMWFFYRRWNRTRAILQAATPLSLSRIGAFDTAWIRGDVECDQPLYLPYFNHSCVHYHYKLEEYVTRTTTTTDSNGKSVTETRSSWEIREQLNDTTPFRVREGADAIALEVTGDTLFHYQTVVSETLGNWRHTAEYIAYPGVVSAVGVVGEGKHTLAALQHVPLMITPLDRVAYVKACASAERWLARGGFIFLVLGFWVALYGILWYRQSGAEGPWWDVTRALVALGLSLLLATFFACLRVYNNLVTFKNRVQQSWSNVHVLLKQRYDLIPNLVKVVEGYMQHERGVLERLTQARTAALAGKPKQMVGQEYAAVEGLSQVLAYSEKYPSLQASAQFQNLAKQITVLEDKIAHARSFFNDSVLVYNEQVSTFPSNLLALLLNYKSLPPFSAEAIEHAVPKVSLPAPAEAVKVR